MRVAQIEDEVFAEQVKKTVELRNGTVHHWLIYTGMDLASGKSTIEKERADLRVRRNSIAVIRRGVEAVFAEVLDEQGQEPMSAERLAELWREDDLPPPDES